MKRNRVPKSKSIHEVFYRSLLWASIGSMVTYGVAEQSLAFAVLSLAAIMGVWLVSVSPSRPAPRLLINTVLLAVVAFAGFEMLRVGVGVSSFAEFAALLLVVKMLDLRSPRDDGQVIILIVAVLISATLTSNSLLTGIFTIIEMVLILRAVVYFQIHTVISKAYQESDRVSQSMRVDIRSIIFSGGFLCAILGGVIFVVMPRNIGVQAFGQWGAGQSVSGFSDSIELGRPGLISSSSEPVMDITITDRNGLNIGRENLPAIYFRGAVLEEYIDGRWERKARSHEGQTLRTQNVNPGTILKPIGPAGGDVWDRQFEVTMRKTDRGETYLFAPWKTVEFRILDERTRLRWDFQRGLFLKDGLGGQTQYVVRTKNMEFVEDHKPFDETDRASLDSASTEIVPEQVAKLARFILDEAGVDPDPATRPVDQNAIVGRVLENYLRTQYEYSLDVQPVPRGADATEWFLIDHQKGHCEFFASALAMMSRSVGIPARVITGYIVSDFNTMTGQYMVRQSNAHAWVEAQVSPGHWKTFDGTPPAEFHAIHEPDPSIWRSMAEIYESIEFFWVRTVVGFDSSSREQLIGKESTDWGMGDQGEQILQRLAAGRWQLLARSGLVAMIVFSISMCVGILLLKFKSIFRVGFSEVLRSVSKISFRKGPPIDEHEVQYAQVSTLVLSLLEDLHIPKPDWKPLKYHLAEQESQIAILPSTTQDAIEEATRFLYGYRFKPTRNPLDSQVYQDFFNQLESNLRSSEN